MPTRRKSTSQRRAPASAKTTRKKAARKKSASPPAGRGLDALARKIVRAATDLSKATIQELYTVDCESAEATGNPAHGHEGLEKKLQQWEQMQKGVRWKTRNVLIGKNVVCIEWDADVTLNDGRTVKLLEVAIHEIKGGKIARERFYYNPMALMPPQN
jgi:ketosteroid isomerase-like protein